MMTLKVSDYLNVKGGESDMTTFIIIIVVALLVVAGIVIFKKKKDDVVTPIPTPQPQPNPEPTPIPTPEPPVPPTPLEKPIPPFPNTWWGPRPSTPDGLIPYIEGNPEFKQWVDWLKAHPEDLLWAWGEYQKSLVK